MKEYLALAVFTLGLYYCLNYTHKDVVESFTSEYDYEKYKVDPSIPDKCYNLLVQKGNHYHLVNTKKAMIPGVNPIKFNDLGEYIEYAKWQQKMNKECPILYLQETFSANGKTKFRLLDDPLNPKGGVKSELLHNPPLFDTYVDASKDNKPYNENSYAGFDEQDQQIGQNNILDEQFLTGGQWNPMQSDWAGSEVSEREAQIIAKERTRNIEDLEVDMFKTNDMDRLTAQTSLLMPQSSKKMRKSDQNEFVYGNKKKNMLIKDNLK